MSSPLIASNSLNSSINVDDLSTILTGEKLSNYKIRKLIGQKLLSSIDPLTESITKVLLIAITPVIADYIMSLRIAILRDNEFRSLKNASSITKVPLATIYHWTTHKLLQLYVIDNKQYVSMTELNALLRDKKTNYQSPKKPKKKPVKSLMKDYKLSAASFVEDSESL